jgi:hypothetical protein
MSDGSAQMLRILTEMRDLLRLLAEPAIAQRDKKLREALRGIAGSATGKKAKAVLLMNGTRNRASIIKECGIDPGDLSNLLKKLSVAELIAADLKQPQLSISIQPSFFDGEKGSDG